MTDLTPQDLLNEARRRYTEEYISQQWNGLVRQARIQDWHSDISDVDRVYRGEAPVICTDETIKNEGWKVTNLVQSNADDISRLTEESDASVQCAALADNDKETKRARIREAAARTYWQAGHGDLILPELALDYDFAGIMALACVLTPDSAYPVPYRIDPRFCYPTFLGNRLIELMVVQTMKAREAEVFFGDVFSEGYGDLKSRFRTLTENVDVVDFYSGDMLAKAVVCSAPKSKPMAFFLQTELNPLSLIPHMKGRLPVAWQRRPTGNSELRGMASSSIGKQVAQNRLVTLTLDYLDQGIYAPLFERGTDLEDQGWGPETVIHGRDADADVHRIQPAISAPAVENMADRLEAYQRNETANPASRAGDIPQSIASAAFVDATQGERSTLIRHINKRLGAVRQEWNEIAFALDAKKEKPLLVPVEGRRTYDPGKDIWRDGVPEIQNTVTYSIGSGLGKLNQYALLNQLVGNNLMPRELAQTMISEVSDVKAAQDMQDRELVKQAILQKALSDPTATVPFLVKLWRNMGEGTDFGKALDAVEADLQRMQAQSEAANQPTQPGGLAPTGTEGAPNAPTEQLSLVKGGVPGNADQLQGSSTFLPPPMPTTQIDIGRRT